MSELDDFSAPASAAPAAIKPSSPLDDFSMPVSSAQQKASVFSNSSPDEAGKALSISKQTGIPASIVQTDLPGYQAHANTQSAIEAVKNPAIAKYVDENRMAPQVSNDDYSVLDKISGVFSKLSKDNIDLATSINLMGQVPALNDFTESAAGREKLRGYGERMRAGFAGGFGEGNEVESMLNDAKKLGLSDQTIKVWEYSGLLPAARALETGIRLVPGLIGGAVGLASGVAEEASGSVAWGDQLLREAPGINATTMFAGGSLARPKYTKGDAIQRVLNQPEDRLRVDKSPAEMTAEDLHQFVAEHTPGGPRAKSLSASETPKDELWQSKPIIDEAKATVAGEALDEAVAASQESKTKERSPELYEKYLEAHGDQGTVHVPAQAILDLYERKGKVPMAGDGLFGFVPGLAEKATLAAETGAEIKIPLSKYVAHVDETVHEGLKDQVRVQENGVTREEAKLAKEEQAAKIEAYHGTPHDFESFDLSKIGTGEGAQVYGHGLYFAENKSVAAEYRKNLAPQKPVDIDMGDPTNPFNKTTILEPDLEKSQLYKVHINADPTHFLDWDKPLSEQPQSLQDYVKANLPSMDAANVTGRDVYETIASRSNKEEASKTLAEAGIPGIKYLDQGSRVPYKYWLGDDQVSYYVGRSDGSRAAEAGPFTKLTDAQKAIRSLEKTGTRNFVVFDDKLVKIVEKNDNPIVQAAVERTVREKQSLYLEPLFKDGESVGITQPEFKRYSDLIDRGQEAVLTKAVALAKREATKRLTPEWRANEARVSGEIEQEITRSPTYLADRYFNFDKGMLPNNKRIISDAFIPMDLAKADEWAPIFGFESGADMTMAVLAREAVRKDAGKGPKWQLKQEVEAETSARMEAQYGKLADNIALEASEAALADHNVDLLAAEVRMLAKLNGKEPPLGQQELTSWIKDQFDKSIASEVSYEQWRRASEKGGREAEKALLKKDYEEAFITKQRQLLAFQLAREAKGFEKEVARAERLFDKYASEVNLPTVEQAYTDQIHRLLQQYGIDTKRTQENTDYNLQGKDFSNFVRERNANGAMIIQANLPTPRLSPNQNRSPQIIEKWHPGLGDYEVWKAANKTKSDMYPFTVDQYRDFATMIKSLDHNGRAEKQIELAGKKEAFNEVIDKVAKNLDTLEKNDFDPDAKGVISGLRALGRAVDSRLLKVEKNIDWIDKKDPLGAMNQAVLRGLIEGEQKKGDMITKLAKMASELPGDRAWNKALDDLSNNKELLDWETGKPMKLTNENKIAIALNYFNESNQRILLEGHHWTKPEVESYLRRELTPMDKAMINGLYNLFEPLAPLVEDATRSRSGVAIPLIKGFNWEGIEGKYWPLMEDPRAKLLGQQVTTDLFQKTNFDPLPTANALKQRTGKVYPLDLTISQVHQRLSQTVHAVFMQEPVINANKVISAQPFREGVYKAFGTEYVTMYDKWIRDIADNGGSDVGFRDNQAIWLSRNLRQNVTVQLMGWKASTALIHGGSAAASSAYENFKLNMPTENAAKAGVLAPARLVKDIYDLGLGQFLPQAAQRFFGSQTAMFDAFNFVFENSGEMRNRQRSLQKDFGFQLDKITNSSLIDDAAKLRAVHQTYSMAMVAYLDQLTATPVWRAAYDHALVEKGLEHDDAVYVADKAVREAHGSASLVSRANIGRGEINKWLTIAYNGYWNHNYNKMREAGKEVGGYDDSLSNLQRVAVGAAFMTAMIVAPALVHHAVRGEESKTTGGAIANMMVSQFGGTVPIVNSLTFAMMHNRDPSVSPIEEVLKSVVGLGKDAMKAAPFIGTGQPVKHPVKDVGKAVGMLTGLPPTNQAIDTFTFMNDVLHRRDDPKSVQEWARGVMIGSSQPKAHR